MYCLTLCVAFLSGSREDSVWRASGPPRRTLRLILETPKLTWSHMLAVAETVPFKRHVVASPSEEDFFFRRMNYRFPMSLLKYIGS